MRSSKTLFAIGLVYAVVGFAAPIPGGLCVEGSVQDYFDLGLTGCRATIGDIDVMIRLGFISGGGSPSPTDLSGILIQPSFSAGSLAGSFRQAFVVSLIPDKWEGMAGQDFHLGIWFNEMLVDQSVAAIDHTVFTSETGQIQAEVCLGGEYMLPVPDCSGDTYRVIETGTTSAHIAIADQLHRKPFVVGGWFTGTLPSGSFGDLTLMSEVTTIPEPSTYVLFIIGTAALVLVRRLITLRT